MLKSKVESFLRKFLMPIVLYSLLSGIVVFYFKQDIVSRPQVSLSLQSARPELIQIFCDSGSGFNEILSSKIVITQAQMNGEPFSLTLPSVCQHLRLDFGGVGSVIKVNSAALVTNSGFRVELMSEIMSPSALNEIKVNETNRQTFTSTGNDPYLVLKGDFSKFTEVDYSTMVKLKLLILFLMVFLIGMISDYFLNKNDQIIYIYSFKLNLVC